MTVFRLLKNGAWSDISTWRHDGTAWAEISGGSVPLSEPVSPHRTVYADAPIPYTLPTTAPWNSQQRAIIPTYDGSNDATHPDVIDFRGIIDGDKWRGYRYWMAMTPYPGGDSTKENPSIVASNNGYDWHVPAGLTNPVVPQPEPERNGYNSDTDIVWDPDTNRMYMFYRPMRSTGETTDMTWSTDGFTWATPVTVMTAPDLISPAVVRRADGTWRAYVIGAADANGVRPLDYFDAPEPEGEWGARQSAVVNYGGIPQTSTQKLWHINVHEDADGRQWWIGATYTTTEIFVGTSTDGHNITWGAAPVLQPSSGWDKSELYRPALTPHEDGVHMRVWYASHGGDGIGYTQIARSEWPAP